MVHPARQVFFTLDHVSLKPIGSKDRVEVHRDGDWHMSVTGFICRESSSPGGIEVLVQERSEYVDIAQQHFDQSIATQMLVEDENNTVRALYRGLSEELGIDAKDVEMVHAWNDVGEIYISKQYSENPELWNREVVTNFLVLLKRDASLSKNFKVQGLEWLPWEAFCNLVKVHPKKFTKSVRIYASVQPISTVLFDAMKALVGKSSPGKFQGKLYYVSYPDMDAVSYKRKSDKSWKTYVYKTGYSMRKINEMDLADSHSIEEILFGKRELLTDKELFSRLER